jgi:hypothetical protein
MSLRQHCRQAKFRITVLCASACGERERERERERDGLFGLEVSKFAI